MTFVTTANMCSHDTIVVQIDNEASLSIARDYILDALMPLDSVIIDPSQERCEILLLLPDNSISRYERIAPFLYRRITPFRKWRLLFSEVTSVEYRYHTGAMRTGRFSIGDLRLHADAGLSIATHEGLTIHIAAARLAGQLIRTVEIDEETHALRTIAIRLFWPHRQIAG